MDNYQISPLKLYGFELYIRDHMHLYRKRGQNACPFYYRDDFEEWVRHCTNVSVRSSIDAGLERGAIWDPKKYGEMP